MVTLDFVSGFPRDPVTKFSQILVIVDKFTKYVILEPCPSEVDAPQTATIFVRRVIRDYGVPSAVISDRGPQFASAMWTAVLKNLGSRVALASTHHPQTDGQSERAIQTLTRLIRAYVRDQSSSWVTMLPLFQFALNNSASSTTRLSPFQLMHGANPIAPVNLMMDQPDDVVGGMELGSNRHVINWARNWWKARRKLCRFVAQNLKRSAETMKRRYDKQRKPFVAEIGDLVLLSVKSHPVFGMVRKLCLRYTGPYVVKGKVHENAYELDGLPPSVPSTQNVQHLRLFYPSPPKFEFRPGHHVAAGPIQIRDHREWEVETIVDHREVSGRTQYLLKWKDHDEKTWVHVRQLQHCGEMLREYQQQQGLTLDFWSESSSSPESQHEDEEESQSDPDEITNSRSDQFREGEPRSLPFDWNVD